MELQVKEETGFSALEMILYLAIVAIICLVGTYVYHAKTTADKTLKAASVVQAVQSPTATKALRANSNPAENDKISAKTMFVN